MPYVPKGQYKAIKAALTPAEKELISYYELQWTLRTHVPTAEEVYEHLKKKFTRIRQTSVNYYLARQPVIKALDQRGIPFRQHTQSELTPTQIAVAITMCNFADGRPNHVKLDQMGITTAQYNAWLKDPQFQNFTKSQADQNLKNIDPIAVTELTKKIQGGDWNAIKFYLETTGSIQNNDQPQTEQLLRMIIEILQRHIPDPIVLTAIARDIQAAAQNRTLEYIPPQQLEGEVLSYDPELEAATKKLGVM
jgi:hypothetical protein